MVPVSGDPGRTKPIGSLEMLENPRNETQIQHIICLDCNFLKVLEILIQFVEYCL